LEREDPELKMGSKKWMLGARNGCWEQEMDAATSFENKELSSRD
jgi:hypothetical protein